MDNINVNEIENKENIEASPRKKKKTIIIIVVSLILICTGFLAWRLINGNGDNDKLQSAVAAELGQLDDKSNAEIEAELNKIVEKGSMSISINSNPVFVNGKSEGSLEIENSPANHYIQDIRITVKETGEEIYHSGLLKPNYHIQKDKLSVDLEKGEYECIATFTAYDISGEDEEYIQVGTAAAEIVITVIS